MDAYTETCGFHNFQQTCITVMVDISRQPESLPRSSCQETPSANTRTTRIVPRWRQWSCFFRRNMASLLFIKSGTKMVCIHSYHIQSVIATIVTIVTIVAIFSIVAIVSTVAIVAIVTIVAILTIIIVIQVFNIIYVLLCFLAQSPFLRLTSRVSSLSISPYITKQKNDASKMDLSETRLPKSF